MANLIVDTNVWVDLENAGLVSTCEKLSGGIGIPYTVDAELVDLVLPTWVQRLPATARDLALITDLLGEEPALSAVDAALLVSAQAYDAVLVTGDSKLRKCATVRKVEVHGVIWMVEELIAEASLPFVKAAEALERMIAAGARLPAEVVDERLTLWPVEEIARK